ncbi:hypothetical protein OAS39_03480 [Pirellulales bacterium]|nr:hypothetical protein [Pirellulales bacterium]
MSLFLGILFYWTPIPLLLLWHVHGACRRNRALAERRSWLLTGIVAWCAAPLLKKAFVDQWWPPVDGLEHEYYAREIAAHFANGQFGDALSYFSIGNFAYRFCVGVFYAITGAPELITYAINAAFGFAAMIALLDVICLHAPSPRLSRIAVCSCIFIPSGLIWTSANLKEGPVLWGICVMLYFTVERAQFRRHIPLIRPICGALIVGLFRPQIACLWVAAIALLTIFRLKRPVLGMAALGGVFGCLLLLKVAAPQLYAAITTDGVTSSLSQRYETLTDNDNLASRHFRNAKPIPIYTGTMLILFRPWPTEAVGAGELMASAEVGLLALMGAWHWFGVKRPLALLRKPVTLAMLAALLLLGFYFSYMYNMGLVVRQRLMAFPAVLFLYNYPLVAAALARPVAAVRRPAVGRSTQSRSPALTPTLGSSGL